MTAHLSALLPTAGPWLLLVLTAAETCFVTGLVVPASVATSLGAFLAAEGHLSLSSVAAAACFGAAAGDSAGFWLGRRYGRSVLRGGGRVRALARRHEPRVTALFGRHPIYAVSFARMVSFVRTLMPWTAGMSRLSYPRFLAYDLLGVTGWATAYLGAGYLAGRSWRWVSGALGTGWAVLFAALGLTGWLVSRHRRLHDPTRASLVQERAAPSGTGAPGDVARDDEP